MRTTDGLRTALAILLTASSAQAQTTERVSIATNGWQAGSGCTYPVISADGRFVAFFSSASNLVAGDTNGVGDVFLRDRLNRTTERVSLASSGAEANDYCFPTSVSANGRFVSFSSQASNLVPGDSGWTSDAFVRDRRAGTTERVSVSSTGVAGDSNSFQGSLSADGRFVAFTSFAANLVPGDMNASPDIFVRDRQSGTTERVSVSSAGVEGNGPSDSCTISADGRYVAFASVASNLVTGEANGTASDIFVRDRLLGTTEFASLSTSGTQGTGGCRIPAISGDGRFVAFGSPAPNLVDGDTNDTADVFVRDRLFGTLERVSVSTAGVEGNQGSGVSIAISGDGRYVAFESLASNLVDGDTNGARDMFVRDRIQGTTTRLSLATGGAEGNFWSGLDGCGISADGRFVAFESRASNLVAGDSNNTEDVFVRDRDTTVLALLCEPAVAGVKICPCANPAAGPGHGCDNSSASGGATLAAAGSARLSADDLVFTTGGEPARALSVLVQGDALVAAGAAYGQGIRCVGGSMKRLFTKAAAGQGITAPDVAAGDPSISARSAARGEPIVAGEIRWYLVYYRDPTVLGGCPSTRTFNATTTRQATWAP